MIDEIGTFRGKPISSMDRDELMLVIRYLEGQLDQHKKIASDYLKHIDARSYLLDDSRKRP